MIENDALGRDSLGRWIYTGDEVIVDDGTCTVVGDNGAYGSLKLVGDNIAWWNVPDHAVMVDLDKSPRHNNHERYFSDFGSLNEVTRLHRQVCVNELCGCCPFLGWGYVFDIEVGESYLNCCGFVEWMEAQATL